MVVRLIGLEPTQPELPDPKSGASTNFATGAWVIFYENGVGLRGNQEKLVSCWACSIFAGAKVIIF